MSANESQDEIHTSSPRTSGNKRPRISQDAESLNRGVSATIKSCNECRQQKLRCDVVKEPFESCSRCQKHHITCKVDSGFKRVAKRNKHAEMQEEIRGLKQELAKYQSQNVSALNGQQTVQAEVCSISPMDDTQVSEQFLGEINVPGEKLAILYEHFFRYYHPLCPLLDPSLSCDEYFNLSPLLAWTIVVVAARRYPQDPLLLAKLSSSYKKLLWATVAEMPQRYHSVKALALLCTWPIPLVMDMSRRSKTERLGAGLGLSEMDPTFMFSGIMMQIALQTGLHRALHAQDFIRQTREVSESEVNDRKLTWAVCNIISQAVSSGNGQPSTTIYDWNLGPGLQAGWDTLSGEIEQRLKIEKFSAKVTRTLYSNSMDLVGLIDENEQDSAMAMLTIDLEELERSFTANLSAINKLSLFAAKVHFSSFAFFVRRQSASRHRALYSVYDAATGFIQAVLDHDLHSNSLFHYCPNHILKTLVSASCILLKLLNSEFAVNLDITQGKALFNTTILALRAISLRNNDFSDRVAEALARMWRAAGSGIHIDGITNNQHDPLELRIRSRMGVSHIYDCIWGWRRSIQIQGKETNATAAVSTIPFLPEQNVTLPYPQTEFFPDQSTLTSTVEDFDLFNSLDWTFDETSYFSWQ